jgi:D-alanine-D-alanine ligase
MVAEQETSTRGPRCQRRLDLWSEHDDVDPSSGRPGPPALISTRQGDMCLGSPLRVLHLLGSSSSEYYYNLSLMYARLCAEEPAIDQQKYAFLFAVVSPDGSWCFPSTLSDDDLEAAEKLTRQKGVAHLATLDPSVVVPHMFCFEGMTSFRSLFDVLKVPYVGCSAENMALATDKAHTKGVLAAAGVRVPCGEHLKQGESLSEAVGFPVVVKPAREDNSLGLSLVERREDLPAALEHAFQYDSKVTMLPMPSARAESLVRWG